MRDVRVVVSEDGVNWWPGPDELRSADNRVFVDGVLLAGLVDQHVHVELVDQEQLLLGGLAGVRDLGGRPDVVFAIARRSKRSALIPRVHTTGPILTPPGGYPTDRAWAAPGTAREIASAEEATAVVAELAGRGAAAVKVALHHEASATFGDPELAAIVAAARSFGLPVVAHAEGAGEPERAVRAGVTELAHTPWTHRLTDDSIQAAAQRMAWTSTIDIHGWGRDTPERAVAIDNLARFHAAGGTVRYGTDLGNGALPTGVNPRELDALTQAGLTPAAILTAIATDPHELTVVASDPLVSCHVLAEVCGIWKSGVFIETGLVHG